MRNRHIISVCLVLLLFFPFVALAQSTSIAYEYWIDDNKDNATSGTVTDSGSGGGVNLNLDVGTLSRGVHYYTIRFYEVPTSGTDVTWSAPQRYIFSIPAVASGATPASLTAYEYWIDDDKENSVTTTISGDEYTTVSPLTSIDISSLSAGVHYYNMRVQDADGIWSAPQRYIFSIPAVASGETPASLKTYQYWIDDDIANAVSTTVSGESYTTESTLASIDVSSLSAGVHYYNMRVQDADGIWSASQRYIFSIPATASGSAPKDLKNIEYWIDDDYSNHVRKAITDDEYTTDGSFASINMADYAPGVHYYNMRVQDEDGIWSAPQRYIFSIPAPQQATEDKLITGYYYAFNNEALKSVTFASPVDEFDQSLSFNVPSPGPLMVVDDDCTFAFDTDQNKANLSRDIHMQFALYFKDQSNTLSAPTVEDFVVNDSQSEDITAISSPGTYSVATHAEGGFSAMSFSVTTSTALAMRASGDCGLRLYDADGTLLNAYESSALQTGVSRTFSAGTYYAIVFGNSEAIKLALYPGDEAGLNALRPSIAYDETTQIATISGTIDGASYYYTINGDNPTIESTPYTEPFFVSQNVTIKAIAAWGDMVVSNPPRSYIVSTIKGDASGDGVIDIQDVVAIVHFILGSPDSGFAENLADMNGDGEVDIFDAMLLVNYVLTHPTSGSGARAMERVGADEPAEAIELSAEQDHIYIGVDQAERFTAFQFDIILPDGVSPSDVKLTSISSAHRLMFARCYSNIYRVVGFSMNNSTFPSVDDKFVDIQLTDVANGVISVINVLFVRPDLQKTIFAGGALGTTAIENIEIDSEATDIYNLKGQKLDNNRKQLDKGVYIINHKKVIIK